MPSAIEQEIAYALPDFDVQSIVFEGEGDFCRAYTVNDEWLLRFAYNDEGSLSLEREIALLPRLAPVVAMPIPNITYFGRQQHNGLTFVGYPKIGGVELTGARLDALDVSLQEDCARDLARFLHELHSFDVGLAREMGVPQCSYPLCRTEEGIDEGSAAENYNGALARLVSYPEVAGERRSYCQALVAQLLDENPVGELPPALIHGDLSSDHVLFDAERESITGVIDFSDAIISTPLLDFMYLYHAYGEEFIGKLLSFYPCDAPQQVAARVTLLHRWYISLRLLWALEHDYTQGIEVGLRQLDAIRAIA